MKTINKIITKIVNSRLTIHHFLAGDKLETLTIKRKFKNIFGRRMYIITDSRYIGEYKCDFENLKDIYRDVKFLNVFQVLYYKIKG